MIIINVTYIHGCGHRQYLSMSFNKDRLASIEHFLSVKIKSNIMCLLMCGKQLHNRIISQKWAGFIEFNVAVSLLLE